MNHFRVVLFSEAQKHPTSRILKHFHSIIFQQKQLINETFWLNDQLKRLITIYIVSICLLITYLFYLVFFTIMPTIFLIGYALSIVMFIMLVSLVIYFCSRTPSSLDRCFRLNQIFIGYLKEMSILMNWREQMKCVNFLDNATMKPIGFCLINNSFITAFSFWTVFVNISSFFFLVFKQ